MSEQFGTYYGSTIAPSSLAALVATLLGLVLFYRGFRLLGRKRLIENTPTSKIRSAALGLIEVGGLAVGPYRLVAPITGASCFYYRTLAWQQQTSGKGEQWRKVADETLHVPFYLDDNTGRVLVNPQGAELDLHRDFHQDYHTSFFAPSKMPPNVRAFLTRYGISDEHKIRIEEYAIKPRNFLFVLGTLAENPGLALGPNPMGNRSGAAENERRALTASVQGGIRGGGEQWPSIGRTPNFASNQRPSLDEPQKIIYLSGPQRPGSSVGTTQQERIAAALRRAGVNNPAAWKAAGVNRPDLGSSLASSSPQATVGARAEDFDLQPRVVLMKGENSSTFLISWRSQQEVIRSIAWRAAASIWGGPMLTLIGIYLLLAHLGWL